MPKPTDKDYEAKRRAELEAEVTNTTARRARARLAASAPPFWKGEKSVAEANKDAGGDVYSSETRERLASRERAAKAMLEGFEKVYGVKDPAGKQVWVREE